MKVLRRVGLVLGIIGALPAIAADNGLLGTWRIVDAVPAPWVSAKERADLARDARKLVDQDIAFDVKAVTSDHPGFACKRPRYEVGVYPPDALFRGALPESGAERVAREFGLARQEVPSVDVDCAGTDFTFHFRDKNTAVTAHDGMIFVLKRR